MRLLARSCGYGCLLAAMLISLLVRAADGNGKPVIVAQVEEQVLAPFAWFAGGVISRNDAELAAQVEGRLVWVADIGAVLQAGEPVARLDDLLNREELAEHTAIANREEARLNLYNQEVTRLSRLARENNAAQSRLDQARADQAVARSELAGARARLNIAAEQLRRTELQAPFGGIVTERMLQAGEWAESGDAVVRLVDTNALEVQVWVPASALEYIRQGDELDMVSETGKASGVVRTLVTVGDDESRLYELRLQLQGQDYSAAQSVRVAVPTAPPRKVMVVPRDALILRRDGASVFVVRNDNSAQQVPVQTGNAQGASIEIQGELQAGDRVVIRGGERLQNGQIVSVVNVDDAE